MSVRVSYSRSASQQMHKERKQTAIVQAKYKKVFSRQVGTIMCPAPAHFCIFLLRLTSSWSTSGGRGLTCSPKLASPARTHCCMNS